MMKLKTKALALIPILHLIAPARVTAADSTVPASTTTTPSPHKRHHRHKKTKSDSATSSSTVAPASPSHTGTVPGGSAVPNGMSDSLGSNNAGSPNMGSPDHTPGTTGTSGQ